MKNIALVAALALATTTASIRAAAACGATGETQPVLGMRTQAGARTAVGVYPRLDKKNGAVVLSLAYPQFDGQPVAVYVDSFQVVRDRNLLRLERRLAHTRGYDLDVTIARVDGTHWRVTGWSARA
jgi:hypothetical protein